MKVMSSRLSREAAAFVVHELALLAMCGCADCMSFAKVIRERLGGSRGVSPRVQSKNGDAERPYIRFVFVDETGEEYEA